MGDLLKGIEYLGIPMTLAIALVSIWLILHIIGFILDIKGKVVPEIINIRGYIKRKNKEKKKHQDLLKRLEEKLDTFDKHYSKDNISKRDDWMAWVNNRAIVYDDALSKLLLLQEKLNENNEITLDLYINVNRNRILDFARIVADDNTLASREEFNRIYKVNKEYHAILAKYNKENGEVDTAMKLIDEAYDYRMKHHSFIEDIRGYNN